MLFWSQFLPFFWRVSPSFCLKTTIGLFWLGIWSIFIVLSLWGRGGLSHLVDISSDSIVRLSSKCYCQLKSRGTCIMVVAKWCTDCVIASKINYNSLSSSTLDSMDKGINLLLNPHWFTSLQKLDMSSAVSVIKAPKRKIVFGASVYSRMNGLSRLLSDLFPKSCTLKMGGKVKVCSKSDPSMDSVSCTEML